MRVSGTRVKRGRMSSGVQLVSAWVVVVLGAGKFTFLCHLMCVAVINSVSSKRVKARRGGAWGLLASDPRCSENCRECVLGQACICDENAQRFLRFSIQIQTRPTWHLPSGDGC